MLLSIIIPTYNSENTISDCLNSVISQTFTSFEVIIVDGLSGDNTLDIIKSTNDLRIKIISEKDSGIYDAMNKGIGLSKGNWLYFLGSDDLLYTNTVLERISTTLMNTKNKVVYGNVAINGNAGWAQDAEIYDGEFDLKKLLARNICHQAIFYKSELLIKHNYNASYKICADYDLNLKLFSRHPFQYINEVIAKFKGGGQSAGTADDTFNQADAILNYYWDQLYKKEFSFIQVLLRDKAIHSKIITKKMYLLLVYIKHRLYTTWINLSTK